MVSIVKANRCCRNLVLLALVAQACTPSLSLCQEKSVKQLFRDGDRVVFLGATFIERMQDSDYLETELTSRFPSRHLTFRNLGWSGDTVGGISRAVFGAPADGFARLAKDLKGTRPTVVVLCYGGNEAHDGTEGLADFEKQSVALLEDLEKLTDRIVLLTPASQERRAAPLPSPAAYNMHLKSYVQSLNRIGKERGHRVIDVDRVVVAARKALDLKAEQASLTENGLHYGDRGYWALAPGIANGLVGSAVKWSVSVDVGNQTVAGQAVEVSDPQISAQRVAFTAVSARLPGPERPRTYDGKAIPLRLNRDLKVKGLQPGTYQVKVDGKTVVVASDKKLAAGVPLSGTWEQRQVAELRQEIVAKNKLYFHRYRPQNETYLFLFRKREQGNNAVEIPQFDPLVEAAEKRIASLKQPKSHRFELVRQK